MIGIWWSMLRARRGQAAVTLLLSAVATAAAVAGPAYLAAMDEAVVVEALASAEPIERVISVTAQVPVSDATDFDETAADVVDIPGFSAVYTARFTVIGVEADTIEASSVTFRQDVCDHLVVVAGRCAVTAGEVMIGESTARRRSLAPGDTVTVSAASLNTLLRVYEPVGPPATLTVTGTYRAREPEEAYWGSFRYFQPGLPDTFREPLFVTRPGLEAVGHETDDRAMEGIAGPAAVEVDRLPALRAELERLDDASGFVTVNTQLPTVLDRIDEGRQIGRRLVPVVAVPLVALCWFVIFLAVAAGATARRHESALVALRGLSMPTRWAVTAGESIVAIVAGAPLGYLIGTVGTALVTRLRFGATADLVADGALPAAGLAVGGALLAGALAHRRQVAAPVVELMRRVPAPGGRWRQVTTDLTAVALAVAALAQLRFFDRELVGLSLLAPGLLIVAVALLCGRVVTPLAGRLGSAALRRGRLGPGLGAVQLARRPGNQGLFVLLTVSLALALYGVAALDVAARARSTRAQVEVGAAQVLTVRSADAGSLLRAVRGVDPTGRYAMAVGSLPGDGPHPPVLLVDAPALPNVAIWPTEASDVPPGAVVAALRPPVSPSFLVTAERIELTVRGPARPPPVPLQVTVVLRPEGGGPPVRAGFTLHRGGTGTYPLAAVACARGCRVAGVEVDTRGRVDEVDLTLVELRAADSGQVVVGPTDFERRWRSADGAQPSGGAGLRLFSEAASRLWAGPDDVPDQLPAVIAGSMPDRANEPAGLDAVRRPVNPVAQVPVLPRLGASGMLMDLEYAARQSVGSTRLPTAQVWLSADAPAGLAERLGSQGLDVIDRTHPDQAQAVLAAQAPALSVWFHLLAGVLAVCLGVGGLALAVSVDRARRVSDARALRRQGLARRLVVAAGHWSWLPLVMATVAGALLSAGAAWWLTGDHLPVFADQEFPLAVPRWPRPVPIALTAVLGAAVFAAAVAAPVRRDGGR